MIDCGKTMDISDQDKYILGETNEQFTCVDAEENQKITLTMIEQIEFNLDILSHGFAPEIYNNEACCEAIETLALRSRHSRVRILLHNPERVSSRGHLVMYLSRRLGSFIQVRAVAEHHKSIQETFMIADGIGVMYRPYADSLMATVNFKDRPTAKELLKLFEQLWENAEPDPNSRYLLI